MLVNKIMHRINPFTPETNLKEAALLMRNEHLGFTPITNKSGKLVGVITDRDIAIRAAANNANMEKSVVKDFMTPEVIACYENSDLEEAIRLMKLKQVHRLIVLNNEKEKKIVGVLSLNDIAKKCKTKDTKNLAWQVACFRSEGLKEGQTTTRH